MTEMKLSMIAIASVLFVCLSPGIFFKMPIKTSPLMTAVLHGVIFGAVLYVVVEASLRANLFENFESRPFCKDSDANFLGGAGKCFNSKTKKMSEPSCPVGTEFDPANSMCGSSKPTIGSLSAKPATGLSAKPIMGKSSFNIRR